MASTLLNKVLACNTCYKHASVEGTRRQNIAALSQSVSLILKLMIAVNGIFLFMNKCSILTGGKELGRGSGFAKFSY